MSAVVERGTAGWWFLDLGFAWLAFRAENDSASVQADCVAQRTPRAAT